MGLSMKDIRKKMGLTQAELAEDVGATKRQIGAWERGENDLPMDYASAIADRLKCSIDDLAGRTFSYSIVYTGDAKRKVEPKIEPKQPVELLGEVGELLDLYRNMTDEGRKQLMIYARGLAATYPKNQVVAS